MSVIAAHADLYLVLACLFGFFMAWGIGANDVSNAMGTSVGSKAITLRQAILIAGCFEFLGAFLAGGNVTATISHGLIAPGIFAGSPRILITGMLAALLGAATFLLFTAQRGLPVSTGQSIIGGILGFGVIIAGVGAVNWGVIGLIVLSWLIAPCIAAAVAFVLFASIRRLILARHTPVAAVRRYLPYYLFLAAFAISLIVLRQGLSHLGEGFSLISSVLYGLAFAFVFAFICRFVLHRVNLQVQVRADDPYSHVERLFGYAQVVTAATMAFAHGSNDVSHAMEPVAAVVGVIQDPQHFAAQTHIPGWVLLLGGAGIVVGLATYGYKVMLTIGEGIIHFTPTRGFSAELSAAMTVLAATWFGIPVSTTQTLVGAVLGVGLARGMQALDLSVLRGVFTGWVITVPASAVLAVVYYFILRVVIG